MSDMYATAKPLLQAGVVFGRDMTSEVSLFLMAVCFGQVSISLRERLLS